MGSRKVKRKPRKASPKSSKPRAKNERLLSFHARIYSAEAILEAARAFEHLATVELIPGKKTYHQVLLRPLLSEPLDPLSDEFANYVLTRTINMQKTS